MTSETGMESLAIFALSKGGGVVFSVGIGDLDSDSDSEKERE